MPATVNGIGTHYYGRKNRSTRPGNCQACGKYAQLESYDTRLWFVVIFIPVIPLGRKRIIDQCSLCQLHFVLKADDWETAKQLNVSGAIEKFRADPSAETALETHGTFLGFHQPDEARRFRESALARFPADATLHAGLALQLDDLGESDAATALFEKAYSLQPDLPEARIGQASRTLHRGDLDQTRELLSFLEQPGSGQDYPLGMLHALADAYQKANRHTEALELYHFVIEEVPDAANHVEFRKSVLRSEKAAGIEGVDSKLPKPSGRLRASGGSSSRKLLIAAAIAALVFAGAALFNEYTRRNRTVHVVSAFETPVKVSIDNGEPITLQRVTQLTLGEGSHSAKFVEPFEETVEFRLSTGYWERFANNPAWLLTPGKSAAFQIDTIFYAVNPEPTQSEWVIGESFHYVPHVDYLFSTAPNELRVDTRNKVVKKVQLTEFTGSPAQLFMAVQGHLQPDETIQFAERLLEFSKVDTELLENYVQFASRPPTIERARHFLQSGLEREPLNLMWHRAWMDTCQGADNDAQTRKYYDGRLDRDPNNAVLLYLRGRIAESPTQSMEWFEKSRVADASFGWPLMGKAYVKACRGYWSESLKLLQEARSTGITGRVIDGQLHLGFLGAREYREAIELERARSRSQDYQTAISGIILLCDSLAAAEQPDNVRSEFNNWTSTWMGGAANSSGLDRLVGGYVSYMLGEFDVLTGESATAGAEASLARMHSLLVQGRAVEIVDVPEFVTLLEEPTATLSLSVAFRRAGDVQRADEWLQKTIELMQEQRALVRSAIPLLQSETAPTVEQLDECDAIPNEKALVLASLYQRFPESELLGKYAQRLNVSRMPPYHLVNQVVGGP